MKYLPSRSNILFENCLRQLFFIVSLTFYFSIFSLVFSPFRVKYKRFITSKTGVSHYLTGMAETIHSVHNCYFTLGGSINMERVKAFLKRKQVVISRSDVSHRCALGGAMAFGLFAYSSNRYHLRHTGEDGRYNFTTIAGCQERDRCSARRLDCLRLKGTDARPFFSAATVGIAGNELGGPVRRARCHHHRSRLGKIVSKRLVELIFSSPQVSPSSPASWYFQFIGWSGILRIHDRLRI